MLPSKETAWNRPDHALTRMEGAHFILAPDFSLFRDQPLAIQLWNTYRSRYLGAYWQAQGKRVIPTVGWSTPDSYQFCFDGLPRNSVLAVSTIGVYRDRVVLKLFKDGISELFRRLEPTCLVAHGEHFPEWMTTGVKRFLPWQLKLRQLDAHKIE